MPDEMTILFTPRGLEPHMQTNANATLLKSSARREKHDVWGTDFKLCNTVGQELYTAETIHLVGRIEKVHNENVEIHLT